MNLATTEGIETPALGLRRRRAGTSSKSRLSFALVQLRGGYEWTPGSVAALILGAIVCFGTGPVYLLDPDSVYPPREIRVLCR